jgi:tight adherence protein C
MDIDWVAFLVDPVTLASALACVATFATVVTLAAPAFSNDKLTSRLKAVANRREELRRKNRAALEGEAAKKSLRVQDTSTMKKFVDKMDLAKMLEDPWRREKAGPGGPARSAPGFDLLLLPLCAADHFRPSRVHLHLVRQRSRPADADEDRRCGRRVRGGFLWPEHLSREPDHQASTSIMRAFPDSLDMMLICVESGMSIEQAFARVGEEIGSASPELAEELVLTTAELSYLQDRRQAYYNLAERNNHPGVKGVAMALVQAEKYGTPLGSALRVMAKENREMRITEAEKKAAALPAKLTVPMIVFFLPVLFLVILGPAFIKIDSMGLGKPPPTAQTQQQAEPAQ